MPVISPVGCVGSRYYLKGEKPGFGAAVSRHIWQQDRLVADELAWVLAGGRVWMCSREQEWSGVSWVKIKGQAQESGTKLTEVPTSVHICPESCQPGGRPFIALFIYIYESYSYYIVDNYYPGQSPILNSCPDLTLSWAASQKTRLITCCWAEHFGVEPNAL